MHHLPSPSMVVALVALGVALGGTAVAGTGLITGAQIKDHSIGLNDLAPTAVAKLRGQRGPAGAQGTEGPQGAMGPSGGFDVGKVRIATGIPITVNPGTVAQAVVACPAGTVEVGGGGYSSVGKLILSAPGQNDATGWTIAVYNDTSIAISQARAYAVCAGP